MRMIVSRSGDQVKRVFTMKNGKATIRGLPKNSSFDAMLLDGFSTSENFLCNKIIYTKIGTLNPKQQFQTGIYDEDIQLQWDTHPNLMCESFFNEFSSIVKSYGITKIPYDTITPIGSFISSAAVDGFSCCVLTKSAALS